MSAQIEARRLSGEHLGKEATVPEQWAASDEDRWRGVVVHMAHRDEASTVRLLHRSPGERSWVQTYILAPTDLVTIHDRPRLGQRRQPGREDHGPVPPLPGHPSPTRGRCGVSAQVWHDEVSRFEQTGRLDEGPCWCSDCIAEATAADERTQP